MYSGINTWIVRLSKSSEYRMHTNTNQHTLYTGNFPIHPRVCILLLYYTLIIL